MSVRDREILNQVQDDGVDRGATNGHQYTEVRINDSIRTSQLLVKSATGTYLRKRADGTLRS